jgi:D-alanyl-D-alanine carboxypeptidase/D-alanyl-D-alanine-endopeptidase (penicillin-binding protein 4)
LFHLPLAVVIIATLLTGTLLGAKRLWDDRTVERRTPVLPTTAGPTAALAVLNNRAPVPSVSVLRAALEPLLSASSLGPGVLAHVVDAASGRVLLDSRSAATGVPASTTKIVTAVATLTALPAETVFRTRALLVGTDRTPTVALVGGGDPTLSTAQARPQYVGAASIGDLVSKTASALKRRGITTVRIAVDDRLFGGPRTGPGWKPNYVPDGDVTPVTALSIDAGRLRPDDDRKTPDIRASDPPLTAGRIFASLLVRAGVHVRGGPTRVAVAKDAPALAAVTSPPVAALVARMLQRSDNDIAEALFRHVALSQRLPATFAGGAAAERVVLQRLGLPASDLRLVDGSGLSLADRVSPRALTTLLSLSAGVGHPELRPVLDGLPVAGFSGTLALRYRTGATKTVPGPGAGVIRAKTGTLTGVSALAGVLVDADGRLLSFALLADHVPVGGLLKAQRALDRVAARLANCGCR